MSAEDSDDDTQLSAHTLAALQDFYAEQSAQQQKANAIHSGQAPPEMPEEDWQLSQFWYNEETATALAKEALEAAGPEGRIACVSCPTMFHRLRELKPDTCTAILLEYDQKFQMYGEDFVLYDYNSPLAGLSSNWEKTFDIVVLDPPFLSEECLSKTAETVKFLAKGNILLCTGAIMEELAMKLFKAKICRFLPKHTRNLANEFRCFANYETQHLDKNA